MVDRSAVSIASRARHGLRTRVSAHPTLYLAFARRKYPGPSPEVVGRHTELVIDGYTRSATTFAVYAFQLAQPEPVRLAHHLHAPAQLIEAARRGLPALVLIREPKGAILSQLVREPRVTMSGALVAYSRFYASLLPHRERFVVGEFEEVTRDFAAVVRRLNTRFGTRFVAFDPTDTNVRECLELAGLRDTLSPVLLGFESGLVSRQVLRGSVAAMGQPAGTDSADTWVPSRRRDAAKRALEEQWMRPSLTRHRSRAEAIYEDFIAMQTRSRREEVAG
jgi:hypothetical protein